MEFIDELIEKDGDFFLYEGKRYIRATACLKEFSDFSHIDKNVLARKTQIGTDVHRAIDCDLKGEFDVPNPNVAKYFCSYLKFMDAWEPKIIKHEKRYGCPELMYCGQIDLVMEANGEKLLVDWKTSASPSESWEFQGHLYHDLLTKSGIEISDRILFVQLNPDGNNPKVHEYTFSQNVLIKAHSCVKHYLKVYNDLRNQE